MRAHVVRGVCAASRVLLGGAVPKFTWPDGTLQTLKRLTTRSNGAKELMWAVHHGSHIEHIYWEQEAPSSARHTPRRLSVAFVDTDGDSIVFKRKGDGTVDYWVNGELEIVSISKIFCNRDTGRLQVLQFGRDGACVTTPKERSDSEAVMELWRARDGKTKLLAAGFRSGELKLIDLKSGETIGEVKPDEDWKRVTLVSAWSTGGEGNELVQPHEHRLRRKLQRLDGLLYT